MSSPEAILQLAHGYWGSRALLAAVELGLFTELAEGPLDLGAVSERLSLHPRGARDFLDALVALGMLERADGLYSNTADTDLFLDRNKPSYVGGLLEMASQRLYRIWDALPEALRTGRRQSESNDEHDFFAALYADPARLESFLSAMTGLSHAAGAAIAAKFPFDRYESVLDVGCAQGAAPVALAKAHPHLTATGFDLPPVGPIFDRYVARHGLEDRVSFHGGDFFKDPLPSADVIVMGHILHDWGLDEKKQLIAKAYDALPPGGGFIAYEALIDDERRANAFGLLMSVTMLLETEAGFDFTGADARGWYEDAGFENVGVAHLNGPDSMVFGFKPA